ncbi:MAG: DUF5719 family protein [Acidimicrobiales bacterium]
MTASPDRRGHRRATHHDDGERSVRRLPVLALVAALLAAGGLAASLVGAPAIHTVHRMPASVAAIAAPVASDASSWYCTGGTGLANASAQGTLYLVSSSPRTVTGTMTVYAGTGRSASEHIAVPPMGQATAVPGSILQRQWLASRVDLQGGGVAVSELVAGSTGWAMAPCSTVAAPSWYFASGSTTPGNLLFVSLFNPTPSEAVADLTFMTTKGRAQPPPFQGLIVAPNAVVTAEVASYVQDQPSVATIVRARSGRVVATELQVHAASGQSGMSIRLGTPDPARHWYLPRTVNVTGGTSKMVVFNPSPIAERVKVAVELPSGPVDPLEETLAPLATWTLDLAGQTRIPDNVDYALAVATRGGPGVVVDRVVSAPSSAPAPQWGDVTAVVGSSAASPTGRWTLPNPALPAPGAASWAAAPSAVTVLNPGNRPVTFTVASLGPDGLPLPGAQGMRIAPHASSVVPTTRLGSGGKAPLVVTADLPLAVMEDATPAGTSGAVVAAAVPEG